MTDSQVLAMLTKAMQTKAPQAFEQMKAAGTLTQYLQNLLAQTLEAISEARQDAISSVVSEDSPQFQPNPLERTQAINNAQKAAEEAAIAQAMEQIEALQAA